MIKGNKGEWSEFYAFLRLLSDRKIVVADENLEKMEEIFYPILNIIREEGGERINYELKEKGKVKILEGGIEIAIVDSSDLKTSINEIFNRIKDSNETTFEIPLASELMTRFNTIKLKAGSAKKEDIGLKIHDSNTGTDPEVGFSIKSRLGAPATLLNASSATNFIYKIENFSEDNLKGVNLISGRSKIRDRVAAITELGGKFSYLGISSESFEKNLRKVDTVLPEIIAELVLAYYLGEGRKVSELTSDLGNSEVKILSFNLDSSDYEFKLKSLLYNIALGMMPGSPWDGLLGARGGYIIVRKDGEIVCYHVYHDAEFRNYLFKNTCFETPSSSRHGFGEVYREGDSLLIKLNFQIRFLL